MVKLNISEAEARHVIEYDKAIDRGEKTEYDLPEDKLNVARKFAHTGTRKPTAYKFTKRERKPNATKAGIIKGCLYLLLHLINSLWDTGA